MAHRATRTLGRASAVVLFAVVALLVGAVVVVPRLVDGVALSVLTGSMQPAIPPGTIVVVRPVDPGTLRPGDVITFQRAEGEAVYVTHRIVTVQPAAGGPTFVTKGDANRGADVAPVPGGSVRGEVWYQVPYAGRLGNLVRSEGAGLAGAAGLLVAYALVQLAGAIRDSRRRSRRTDALVTAHDEAHRA